MSPIDQILMNKYLLAENESLRTALSYWLEMPAYAKKFLLDANIARNEVKKIMEKK